MCKSSDWLTALHLDVIDPFHVLDVEDGDVLVVLFVLEIGRAEVSSEEDQ